MRCKVCDGPKAEFHFGGISCRACAAFFRRYVHSPKRTILCSCSEEKDVGHACRRCRMEKCLAAWLTKCKVQPSREKNDKKLEVLPTTSLTTCTISNRDYSTIRRAMNRWEDVSYSRRLLYGDNMERLNFYEISCLTRLDAKIIWPLVEDLFPILKTISKSDKDALISNFMAKYFVIQSTMKTSFNVLWFKEPSKYLEASEENVELIVNFYGNAMPEKYRLEKEEILRIFEPLWMFYYQKIVMPIYEKQHDEIESVAQLLLILLDAAYTNISDYCAKHCDALRNMILRELRGYQLDLNLPDSRFIDVMENMLLVEKADVKFQEEIQICELYNVRLHDDFRSFFLSNEKL